MKKNQNGLTFIEVLILITIAAILGAIIFSLVVFSLGGAQSGLVGGAQSRARALSDGMVVELPPNHKLVTATWENQRLWYLVRSMGTGDTAETNLFIGHGGAHDGAEKKIVFKESKLAAEVAK
ncbi:MAG: hypothetical protein UX94_C0003G0016 [Parcubacteria group bacterium GW2011_GWA2_47_21]|nr:MAG: hypothetical protein UX94_C0003G0016 [Parcubacteria group bacterium GW2011_GWA2_47_21]